MLRMYECNWCRRKQVKDDGSVIERQAGDRMASEKAGYCVYGCRTYEGIQNRSIMFPMTRDRDGDWEVGDGSSERNRVVPPIIWH